jgi:hypothetical protein
VVAVLVVDVEAGASRCRTSSAPGKEALELAERRLASGGAEHSLFAPFGGAWEEDLGGVHVALGD